MVVGEMIMKDSPKTSGLFAPTGLALVMNKKRFPIYLSTDAAKAWDGAAEGTNAGLYSDRHDVFMWAEVKLTGRSERTHTGGVWGTKAKVRFTGPDDAGEWHDAVVHKDW